MNDILLYDSASHAPRCRVNWPTTTLSTESEQSESSGPDLRGIYVAAALGPPQTYTEPIGIIETFGSLKLPKVSLLF